MTLVAILLVLFSFSINTTTLTQAHCLPHQHHALIQLKQDFNTTQLHSWNSSTDCCKWDGITCNEKTGMVIALNLPDRSISGEINPALFNLNSLRYLDLSFNYFYNITLPQYGFERLGNLTHLYLSNSGFAGPVPIGISTLTKLIELDLSHSSETNQLYLHNTGLTALLNNLTKLQVLRLDAVDISHNGSEWVKAIFHVSPTLQQLTMQTCGLRGNLPNEVFHLTNLTDLDLSLNFMLSGQLPEFKQQCFLQYLNLGYTNFSGPLPDSIGNLQYLSSLVLPNCNLYGDIPSSITNITRFQDLELGSNKLTGKIPMDLFSLPFLDNIDLSENQLLGYVPKFVNESSSNLQGINLRQNNLQGELPISIFKLSQLTFLELGSNNFNGTLNLDVISHSKNLDSLGLSNNKLSILEDKNHNESFYASFPQLSYIGLASCNLAKFPSFLSFQTNVFSLDLSNNKVNGVIPNWLHTKNSINYLNLSHNFFTKLEEDAHYTALDKLQFLDIHSNMILGPVPLLPPEIMYVDFSSNYFFALPAYFVSKYPFYLSISNNSLTGEIPHSICNATLPQVLDLSYNNLVGTMPPCLLENAELEVLNLRSNKLSGPLSRNISQGCTFRTLDLSGNKINGTLPESLMNCSTLEVLDLGNNQIADRFPFWLGNLKNLRVLVLRSNQFYGTISNMEAEKKKNSFFPKLKVFDLSSNYFGGIIPKNVFENMKAMVTNSDSSRLQFGGSYFFTHYYHNSITVIWKGQEMEITSSLRIFSSLDLSHNGFSGEIPEEIGQLKSLDVLNLSHNALIGPIPMDFVNLQQLQSMDLSSNKLSGHIPQELTSLTFLSALNLSYNNLVGQILDARQFSTFSNASYLGNPGLCGGSLSLQCPSTLSNNVFNKGLHLKSSTDIIELSISIGLGFGAGFAFVICTTISWENGRKWFNFIIDRFYFQHFY